MATNKFPGTCKCGQRVEAGAGTVAKVRGKWMTSCTGCVAPVVSAPARVFDDQVEWPNGMGHTECTTEYADAAYARIEARDACLDAGVDEGSGHPLALAWMAADRRVAVLQHEGHVGRRVTYDRMDPLSAMLGGGRMTVRPGGSVTFSA